MKWLCLALLGALATVGAAANEPPTFRVESLPTSLAGEWLFRTGHDPAWSSPFRERQAWQPIQVPGCWQRTAAPGFRGHAWYVTRLFIPSHLAEHDLALDLGVVADAEEVFLNGRLIGARGTFPPRPTRAVPSPRLYRLPRVSLRYGELNELVVHAYSTAACGGLLGPPPRIAEYGSLLPTYVRRDLLLGAVAALLLTLAALHLVLFAAQREESVLPVFAVLLALAAVFFFTQTTWGPTQLLSEGTVWRLHISAMLGGVAAFVSLVYGYLRAPVPIPLITLQAALVLGIAFAAVWRSTSDLAVLVHGGQATLVLAGPYLLYKLLRAARLRRPQALPALAATTLLAGAAAIDIATQVSLLPRRSLLLSDNTLLLGIIPFAMTFTVIFFQRWAKRRWGEVEAGGGVLPREKFLRRLEVEMERGRRNGASFSVALLRLSSSAAPERLETFIELASHALRRTLRQIDALAVLRADTFAVLLADADELSALLTVERLRLAALEAMPGGGPPVAIAAGVAQFRRGRHHLAHDFVAEAEAALYAAQAEGRNVTATTP